MILQSWKEALFTILSPKQALSFLNQARIMYGRALSIMFSAFWMLYLIDAAWFFLFYELLSSTLRTPGNAQGSSFLITSLIFLVSSILWFILTAFFFLSVRLTSSAADPITPLWRDITSRFYPKSGPLPALYFINGLLRYTQLSLVFSLFYLIILIFLANMGVVYFPSLHWSIFIIVKLWMALVMFFWLDSPHTFSQIFISVERATNFFFYNLPFFFLPAAFYLVLMWGMSHLFQLWTATPTSLLSLFLHESFLLIPGISKTQYTIGLTLVRYLKLFIEAGMLSLIYTFYVTHKETIYTSSLFQPPASEE